MTFLSKTDYKKVLQFYNKPIPRSTKDLKNNAEKILVDKLCRCIKKVKKSTGDKNENRSIGICKDSVLHKKKVGIHGFTCKKNQQFRKFPKRTSKMKKYVKPTKNKQTRKRKN